MRRAAPRSLRCSRLTGIAGLLLVACHPVRATWSASEQRLCSTGLAGGAACYRVGPLGPGWRVIRVARRQIGFFNDALDAIAQANVTCREDSDAAPLVTLTRQLLIGYTDQRTRAIHEERLAGRGALHTVVDARLDGVPRVLDLHVLKRNGCIFDLSLAAPPDRYAAAAPPFAAFVAGFTDERAPERAPQVREGR